MTPKERAMALWESWLVDGVDDDQRMRADVASTIRAAEDEALERAARRIESQHCNGLFKTIGTRASVTEDIRSLKSSSSAPGGERP